MSSRFGPATARVQGEPTATAQRPASADDLQQQLHAPDRRCRSAAVLARSLRPRLPHRPGRVLAPDNGGSRASDSAIGRANLLALNPAKHTTSSPDTEPRLPARADVLESRLSGYSRFGSDLDGGTADTADFEQPTFPSRDRDEEHAELPELPDPRLQRGVVATQTGSSLPRAETLLFRAKAEDEEHRASVGRRAAPGRLCPAARRSSRSRSRCRRASRRRHPDDRGL